MQFPSQPAVCDFCGQTAASLRLERLRKCSRCLDTCFCSKACQASAWPKHKTLCLPPQAKAAKLVEQDATTDAMSHFDSDSEDDDSGEEELRFDHEYHDGKQAQQRPGGNAAAADQGAPGAAEAACSSKEAGEKPARSWPPLTAQAALLALECCSYCQEQAVWLVRGIRYGRMLEMASDEALLHMLTSTGVVSAKNNRRKTKLSVEKMKELEVLLGVSCRNNVFRRRFAAAIRIMVNGLHKALDPACTAIMEQLRTIMPQVHLCRSLKSPHSSNLQLLDHVYRTATALDAGLDKDQWMGLPFFLLLADSCLKGLQVKPVPGCPLTERHLTDVQRATQTAVEAAWVQLYRLLEEWQDDDDDNYDDEEDGPPATDEQAVQESRRRWYIAYVRKYEAAEFSAPGAWIPVELGPEQLPLPRHAGPSRTRLLTDEEGRVLPQAR